MTNVATATGRTPQGTTATATSPTAVVAPAAAAPALVLTKTGALAAPGAGNAGDVVTYTFTLRNSGNVTITNAAVSDPLVGLSTLAYTWPGATGTLAPGQTATATATYPLTQANVNAGSVSNTASATGRAPSGATVTAPSASATVATSASAPGVVVTKSGALASGATGVTGDTVNWSFTIRNSGNVTLTAVEILERTPGVSARAYTWPAGNPPGTLQPGQTATATATSILTQNDLDAGSIVNTAYGRGVPPTGAATTGPDVPATVALAPRGTLTLTKTPSTTTGVRVNDVITYTLVARNTGNVTLTGTAITDPLAGLSALSYGTWPTGTTGVLRPGDQITATATYTVRQSDINTGTITNRATATATTPQGATATGQSPTTVVTTTAASPGLSTTKSAAYTTGTGAVDSVLRYSFAATNTGNVTLTGVTITDPLTGLSTLSYGTWPSGTTGVLQPGQTVTATASYTVTQSDVNRGSIVNRATATGTAPSGTTASAQSSQVTTATVAAAPSVTLTKSGTAAGQTAGSIVTYSFTLTNSGNVTLTGAAIADPLVGLSAPAYGTWPSGTAGLLQPGQSVTATASYALTQADIDAGSVVNTATATATPPSGASVTQQRTATVPITPSGALAVAKSGAVTAGSGGVGSTITWSFAIRNAGNVTLTQIALTDTLAGLSTPSITWPAATGVLGPGQTATATASSTITQAQLDAGTVTNTATATGRTPAGTTATSPPSTATVTPAAPAPAVSVVKSGVVSGGAAGNAGDVIAYTFVVTNSGNTTLTGVTVSDPLPGLSTPAFSAWPGTPGRLTPGQSATATATYTIKQSDVNTGAVVNTATANGTPPSGPAIGSTSTISTPTAASAPALTVTKSGVLAPGATGVAGDTVTWSFTIRNAGNVTVTGAEIVERTAGVSARAYTWPSGNAAGTLQPGQSATATATSVLTQADIDAGSIINTAYGRALPPTGAAVTGPDAAATVSLAPRGTLTLAKTPSATTGVRVDDVITYTLTATNTGNVTLTGATISDPLTGLSALAYGTWPSGTTGVLRPGDQITATATYPVRQSDVNAGTITNRATVSATTPQGAVATAQSPSVAVTTVAASPGLTTTKSASYTTGTGGVNSVITYTFTTRNSGNVTLTGVGVSDPLPGLSTISYGTWPSGTAGVLQPGQAVAATATYTVLQADVDRGSVANQSTAVGTPPAGPALTARSANIVTATAPAAPDAALSKTGGLVGTGAAGDTIAYTFVYTNLGNVTLSAVTISDPLLPSGVVYGAWPGAAGVLSPGQSVTASGTYTVTQADVDAGSVVNVASSSAAPPTGSPLTRSDTSTVTLAPTSTLDFTKSAAYETGTGAVGSTIRYTFTATNTGNVTLSNVAVSDPLPGLSAVSYDGWPSGTTGVLRPNDTVTASALYTVTQSDVDAGAVTNTANLAARTPQGAPLSFASPTVSTPTVAPAPAIDTSKSASVSGGGAVGSIVTYTIRATNTGNVTLSAASITDPFLPATSLQYGTWPSGSAGVLRPGDVIEATARHTVTQADADAGSLTNTASSAGTPPSGPVVSDDSPTVVTPLAARTGVVSLTHTGALPAGSPGRAGDVITFTYTVTNAGTTTLTGVAVSPTLPMTTGPTFASWPGPANTLLPGQSATATSSYVLTQADVDAGSVSDPATATGVPPAGVTPSPATATTTATVPVQRASTISIAKTGRLEPGPNAGQTGSNVLYDFVVRNTGTTTLTVVGISDPLLPAGAVTFGDWPGSPGTLLPGQQVSASATHAITLDEFVDGRVVNTAQAFGTSPTGPVSAPSGRVTVATGDQAPSVSIGKSAAYTGTVSPGDVGSSILYTFSVSNTGNVPLTGVRVVDPRITGAAITVPGTLGVGATTTATATYVVTQADVDAGAVVNQASASAIAPGGSVVAAESPVVRTDTAPAPALLLDKTAEPATDLVAGAVVDYTLTLSNAGNVTLRGVAIDDPLLGGPVSVPVEEWSGDVGVLAPGDEISVAVPYTVTQADVDAGSLVNVATAQGLPASGGAAVTVTDAASIGLRAVEAIELTKTATVSGGGSLGDVVTYRFEALNTGTTTLTGVSISDPLVGLSAVAYEDGWSTTTSRLAPGGVVAATATFTITQAVLDAGTLSNTASVTSTAPDGSAVTDASNAVLLTNAPGGGLAPADSSLTVTKTAVPAAGVRAGDVITYTVRVANTGNVTVSGITVTDPLTSAGALSMSWPGTSGVLAPTQTAQTTTTHRVTQADIDAGGVVNIATAEGTGAGAPGGIPTLARGTATTPAVAAGPQISVTDTGALAAGGSGLAGDTVEWTYVVTNTGNVTLTGVSAAESLPIVPGSLVYGPWPTASGRLEPGQSVTVTSRTVLTQPQIDAGEVTGTVTARGTPPTGPDAVDSATGPVDIPQRTGMDLVKTGALADGDIGQVGDRVEYTLSAVNTGNVTLHRVDLVDRLPGLVITSLVWPDDPQGVARDEVIPPGARAFGTGYVILTQAHIDAGEIVNQADVEGYTTEEPVAGEVPVDAVSDEIVVPTVSAAPQLTATTRGDRTGSGAAGDTITWTSVLTNTGNVTIRLDETQFTDLHPYSGAPTYTWNQGSPGVLQPGHTLTMVGTSLITQAEVDAGAAMNAATGSGTPVRGPTTVTSNTAIASVPTSSTGAAIDIAKIVTAGPGFTGKAGDSVLIAYTLTNTGGLTLTSVGITDTAALVAPGVVYDWPAGTPDGTLIPGGVVQATATHILTQADVDAGIFETPATGVGTAPAAGGSVVVRDVATDDLRITAAPDMEVVKSGVLEGDGSLGTRILYSFAISNTGNVTLTLVDLVEQLTGVSDPAFLWPDEDREGVVAPGETAEATAVYTITQADVDAGRVTNLATASGKPPLGDTIYRESNTLETPVASGAPSFRLAKTATPSTGITVGSTIEYVITATNDGNQTLTGVQVTDLLPGAPAPAVTWPGAQGTLLPTQSAQFLTSHVVTQADIDAGGVTNVARASAATPGGTVLPADASAFSRAVIAAPAIDVTDSGRLAAGATGIAGDEIVWTYVVANAGNVTLTGVDLSEALGIVPGSLAFAEWPGQAGVLVPGQSVTATSRYVLTQADVDAGTIRSTVTTRGSAPAGATPATVGDTATGDVEIAARPGLEAVKSGELPIGVDGEVGDRVLYSLTATNTGNVTLYGGALQDRLPGLVITGIQWPVTQNGSPVVGLLPPGSTVTGQAYVVIRQSDLDRGYIENTAGVFAYTSATQQDATTIVENDSNTVVVTMAEPNPILVSSSAGSADGEGRVGETITWTHTLANTGNVTVTVDVADFVDLDGLTDASYSPAGPTVALAPGESLVLTGRSTISQADVDAGAVIHRASGSGTPLRGDGPVVSNESSATVATQNGVPAIELTKSAATGAGYDGTAGSPVVWTYTIRNGGNVTLTGVDIADPLADLPDGVVIDWGPLTPGVLPVGATVTATAAHALTQAEVDAGRVGSTATVTGIPPRAAAVTDTAAAGLDVAAAPSLTVGKEGAARGDGGVGDVIDYDFRIVNTGNVTLTLVDLVDQLAGVSLPVIAWPDADRPGVVLPGETATATATYAITQADVDAGTITNRATASGQPPTGPRVDASSPAVLTAAAPAAPALTVDKSVDISSDVSVDDVLTYTITVTNSGNVTVESIGLSEMLPGTTPVSARWPGPDGVLRPGETAVFTTTYQAAQSDIDAGAITNTVRVDGVPVRGTLAPIYDSATSSTVAAQPSVSITDSGALAAGATGVEGDEVLWTYVVRNTGNTTLSGVAVIESGVTLIPGSLTYTWPGADGILSPGQSATVTARSALTQAQVDAETATSVVRVDASTPAGTVPSTVSDTDTADVAVAARPSLSVVKTGALAAGAVGQVGDRVDYTLVASNTGNVTLHRGDLVDPLAGLVITGITWPVVEGGAPVTGLLPPGSVVSGTGYVLLTQADVDRGYIENIADIAAYRTAAPQPDEVATTALSNRVVVPTIDAAAALESTTTGSAADDGEIGDVVTWRHTLTNTGNVAVTLSATDYVDADGLVDAAYDWSGAAVTGRLAPGEFLVLTGTSTIRQSDVDRGFALHRASGTAASVRDGSPVASNVSGAEVPTEVAAPSILVDDQGALATPADAVAGGTVVWTYRITNTGNVTLSSVSVSDALPGVGAPVYDWTTPEGVLAPGQFVDVTATYTLTQADVDAGSVVSVATATGTPPVGAPATSTDPATVIVTSAPSLTVDKTGRLETAGQSGVEDWVLFEFEIVNRGNVTLSGVTLSDALPGLSVPQITWPAEDGVLAPGATATATARYQLSQGDVDAGEIRNRATVTALPPVGAAVIGQSNEVAVATEDAAPGIRLIKAGALYSGSGAAGSVVRYTFDILNTGNVSLRGIDVGDALAGVGPVSIAYPNGATSLEPGQTATAFADYTLLQADLDRGWVDNTADATATAARGADPSATSNTFRYTTVAAGPAITSTQTAMYAGAGTGAIDDVVEYTFRIRNSGNVTLTAVEWAATVSGLRNVVTAWPAGTGVLSPGQELVITAERVVTQADVDLGVIRNELTGSGTPPTGPRVSDTAPVSSLPLAETAPALLLEKTGVVQGDTIVYGFRLENSGDVTLTGAAIDDRLEGLGTIVYDTWSSGTAGLLAPGQSVTATALYPLTQDDVDLGSVVNTATASATAPGGGAVSISSPEIVVTLPDVTPAIEVSKTPRFAGTGAPSVGGVVEYDFTVTNTGDVTLTGVTIADDQARISDIVITWPGADGVLRPGETATATARYTLTQGDIDAGTLGSTVRTAGTGIRGGVAADDAEAALPLVQAPRLLVDKTASAPSAVIPGQSVGYRIEATNAGNVTLTSVEVLDDLLDESTLAVTWPGTPGALIPGESVILTGTRTITVADVAAGSVANSASASAQSPTATTVTGADAATVAVPNSAAISLALTATLTGTGAAGDTVTYTYVVTNTGPVPLTGIALDHGRPGLSDITWGAWPGTPFTLQPGESVTASATYVLTPADVGTVLIDTATVRAAGATPSQIVLDDAATRIVLPSPDTSAPSEDPLATTGAAVTLLPLGLAAVMLLWGILLVRTGSRRKEEHL
ncbi:MAG: AraC family transcriptional regulator [Microbacterium sp.]